MEHITHEQLKKMFLFSYKKIEEQKEQINKINVFPVPDQDTGTNMSKTLWGIKEAIEKKDFKDFEEISAVALDGALTYAQGNAGVIYTGFLAGFLSLLDKNPINAKKLSLAFEKGAERARLSIQNPKEGTILDVIDAAKTVFQEESEKENDIIKILIKATKRAKDALLATREKMEIFRKANVVDAGGLAFLMILESYLESLEPSLALAPEGDSEKSSEKIKRFVQTISYRYEIVCLIKDLRFDEKTLQKKMKNLGNSLDIVRIGDRIKLHIHTDFPDGVKQIARESGEIESLRVEDMAKEVMGEPSLRNVSIGIVTEDIASLLPKILERYQIEIAPAIIDWPDFEKIPGENIYQKLREIDRLGIKTFPKTSQATPKSYLEAFEKQFQKPSAKAELGAGLVPHRNGASGAGFEKILCVTISSKLSGCYNSALQARSMTKEPERIFVLDSQNAAAGQALLILRALELIQEQREIAEIVEELKNSLPKIHLYAIFEDPKYVESIGRISKSQADWARRMKRINLHPLMALKDGVLQKGGIIFAKNMAEAIFKKIVKESKNERKQGRKIRVVINQADNLEGAENLKTLLKKEIEAEISFIGEVPTLIGTVVGPGTLLAAWMPV